ncbi:hypothetical protein EMCRGX_G026673 [Ephydatia muelleri]
MPKKKVKGKSKGKGKGKGKGKAKKEEKKVEKDEIVKDALANAKLWEVRYAAADKSRQEYRENVLKLVSENEQLRTNVIQTERDTIEVIAFLKKEDKEKDTELGGLRQDLKDLHHETHKEREVLVQDYSDKVKTLDEQLKEKTQEVLLMQNELKTLQEFRKKKVEMQSEIDRLEKALGDVSYQHKVELGDVEQKFFEEKMRLQKEANKRVADLAEKAHQEAIGNLDARTREIYRQNLQMAEALEIYKREGDTLKKEKERLEVVYRQLVAEKEVSQQLVEQKVCEGKLQRRSMQELRDKVAGLEDCLNTMMKEFGVERTLMQERHKSELEKNSAELVSLRRTLKREIAANRHQYRHNAQAVYHQRMSDATRGKAEFPHIKTFRPVLTSTSNVYQDMEEAERWDDVKDGVDISDLTWEQKEQVLRLMFSNMNHHSRALQTSRPRGTSSDIPSLPEKSATFLTER